MRQLKDRSLGRVLRILLKRIREEAEHGRFPVFPPNAITVLSRRSVRYREEGQGASDLRECLRQLGVTLYHLATGESEYTKESYLLDKHYRPIESELWPVLELLLSGNAWDVCLVRQMMSRRRMVARHIKHAAGAFFLCIGRALAGGAARITEWRNRRREERPRAQRAHARQRDDIYAHNADEDITRFTAFLCEYPRIVAPVWIAIAGALIKFAYWPLFLAKQVRPPHVACLGIYVVVFLCLLVCRYTISTVRPLYEGDIRDIKNSQWELAVTTTLLFLFAWAFG